MPSKIIIKKKLPPAKIAYPSASPETGNGEMGKRPMLLRRLLPLDSIISFPISTQDPETVYRKEGYRPVDFRASKAPLSPVLAFLNEANVLSIHSNNHAYAKFLYLNHERVFGTLPLPGTHLEDLRRRIAYRLQYEGHRLTGTEPSPRFMERYQRVMDISTWKTESRDPVPDGKPQTHRRGVVTMASLKKATKVVKVPKAKKVTKARTLVFDKYPPTAIIRWLAKELDAHFQQITDALKALGIDAAEGTVRVQRFRAISGQLPIPKVTNDEAAQLRRATPKAIAAVVTKAVKAKKVTKVPVVKDAASRLRAKAAAAVKAHKVTKIPVKK